MDSVLSLVWQVHPLGKIILLLLISMSIIALACALFINNFSAIRRREFQNVFAQLDQATSFDQLLELSVSLKNSAPGRLFAQLLFQLRAMLKQRGEDRGITEQDFSSLRELLWREFDHAFSWCALLLRVLLVFSEIAPLLGLFGTVGGLINAFLKMGALKNADITTMAPGIAEALVTTLAGLFATIVAVISYHQCAYLLRQAEELFIRVGDRALFLIRPYRKEQ